MYNHKYSPYTIYKFRICLEKYWDLKLLTNKINQQDEIKFMDIPKIP